MSGTTVLPLKALKPLIQPTWQIGKPKENACREIYVLANGAESSITNNVRIDANPNYFTFILKKELGDLVGIGVLRFAVHPTDGGATFEVDFAVTYQDANCDENTDYVPAKFGFSF